MSVLGYTVVLATLAAILSVLAALAVIVLTADRLRRGRERKGGPR